MGSSVGKGGISPEGIKEGNDGNAMPASGKVGKTNPASTPASRGRTVVVPVGVVDGGSAVVTGGTMVGSFVGDGSGDGSSWAIVATGGSVILVGTTMDVGETYYVSGTAGSIIPDGDLTTNDFVSRIGTASSATTLDIDLKATGVQHS